MELRPRRHGEDGHARAGGPPGEVPQGDQAEAREQSQRADRLPDADGGEGAPGEGDTPEEIKTGGLKVYTTFDKKLVQAGVEAVKTFLPDPPDRVQVAMASVDVETGAVKAIYGGHDYIKRSRNAATEDTAMAGSTFKPFCLVAALDNASPEEPQRPALYTPQGDYPKPVRNLTTTRTARLPAATASP